ncbi:TIGR03086 family metal-binding protein [Mycolicibacterium litorale]|nr:TIGR03086 family metal-binding protein [Mycolicibacterium litorale]MCV7417694.1 TIGR03086 family protein [Mycolicibacterium litorale]
MNDLSPACRRTADAVMNVPDELLDRATPCDGMRLSELLAHVGDLARAFTAAARKDFGEWTDTPPQPGPPEDDWRSAYPRHLTELADAWRSAEAWTGMTRAGGIDLPGEVAGLVALTEVVVHGWDVAAASGQPYDCDATTAQVCLAYLGQFDPAGTEGMFGRAVPVPDDAPAIDRIVGLSGRDPRWRPH